MFTLRKVFPDGSISNTYLGDYYMTVRKSIAIEKFTEILNGPVVNEPDKDGIFAFIITKGYAEVHSLHHDYDYYIVNDRGTTFDREYKRIK